ncbi:MAG: BadF/BadG/BcrA/BcrD ATPase family protein [Thermodesulfobacteriota bacterium]
MTRSYYAGFDVGSSAVHYAVIDGSGAVAYSARPFMHFADPISAIRRAWADVVGRFPRDTIQATAFTGSGAEFFPEVMPGAVCLYDSVSIPAGAIILNPEAECVIHIGAKDAYFFRLRRLQDRTILQDWKAGSKCGGGTGTLIQKQCRRLFQNEVAGVDPEKSGGLDANQRESAQDRRADLLQEMDEAILAAAEKEAARSSSPSEFLARCGVVIQSDLIHKQNEGANRADNLAGLFRTVARNYKIDVMGNESLQGRRAMATGGVVANKLVLGALSEFLDVALARPEGYQNVGAIGAAAAARERNSDFVFTPGQLESAREYGRRQRKYTEPLYHHLDRVRIIEPNRKDETLAGREIVIGIDGGSTTTKGALVDLSSGRLLDKLYIKTHGDPEGSLKKVIRYLGRHQSDVIVRGIGVTGSARKLYEKILISRKRAEELKKNGRAVVDRVTDEITCHALGVQYYNPGIDTIFEIGGQDMKFTTFNTETGAVRNAKMNYSCQAGSGQTMENMADLIGLDVTSTLQDYALRAERVPIIDATCGVFMEMDENRLIAEGFSREEIAAAIVRGTAASYFYKFVGGAQQVGESCSAQGGPCLGDAFLAALSQVTGRTLYAYPDREIFGAWGAALDVIREIQSLEKEGGAAWDTAFRGWSVMDMPFDKNKRSCREVFGSQSCGIRDCGLHLFKIGEETIISNGFCPRGNSEATGKPRPNYVDIYHSVYEKHFKRYGSLLNGTPSAGTTIGVRRSTSTLGPKGIWSAALLAGLGLHPVVTPRSDQQIARIGVDHSQTSFCIARKLATGHAKVLADHPGIKLLYNPAFVEVAGDPSLKYCVYTESEPYLINGELALDKERQILPVLEFGEPEALIETFIREFRRLGLAIDRRRMKRALARADAAEAEFLRELAGLGDKFLARTAGEIAYVGVGRDYVVLDPEASSNSGSMFAALRGLHYLPQIFLHHRYQHLSIHDMAKNEYWVESVDILKAHRFIAGSANLFPVRMMNFGCGPDSMKLFQEDRFQERAGKPMLTLLTDAQTNNAPFVTRTEAFERVVGGVYHG